MPDCCTKTRPASACRSHLIRIFTPVAACARLLYHLEGSGGTGSDTGTGADKVPTVAVTFRHSRKRGLFADVASINTRPPDIDKHGKAVPPFGGPVGNPTSSASTALTSRNISFLLSRCHPWQCHIPRVESACSIYPCLSACQNLEVVPCRPLTVLSRSEALISSSVRQ